ncbi:expressed unknown protein [Seminavis robusta]|uniref:Uncharacterized protein n=1 Tax=Seminavis robusta TaxID=568900 RepID=A0A9N8EKW9_9STRA|nr:expressed unknown protein [Seminavis robusta]|eukprot:Sro1280_g258891.1  (117) ;mRNA; r:23308-23658
MLAFTIGLVVSAELEKEARCESRVPSSVMEGGPAFLVLGLGLGASSSSGSESSGSSSLLESSGSLSPPSPAPPFLSSLNLTTLGLDPLESSVPRLDSVSAPPDSVFLVDPLDGGVL